MTLLLRRGFCDMLSGRQGCAQVAGEEWAAERFTQRPLSPAPSGLRATLHCASLPCLLRVPPCPWPWQCPDTPCVRLMLPLVRAVPVRGCLCV